MPGEAYSVYIQEPRFGSSLLTTSELHQFGAGLNLNVQSAKFTCALLTFKEKK